MRKITLEEILRKVCDHYGITEAQMTGICQKHIFVKARHLYAYVAINATKKTSTQIAKKINKNRSTISHAKKKISNLMDVYPAFKNEVLEILKFDDFDNIPMVAKEVNLIQLIKENKLICSK